MSKTDEPTSPDHHQKTARSRAHAHPHSAAHPPVPAVSAQAQPPYTVPAPGQPAYYTQPQPPNPGEVTGIIGIVLFLTGFAPIGLVLSIVSTVQSAKANAPKTLGIIGIVINALGIIIGTIILIIVIAISAAGVSEERNAAASKTNSNQIMTKAEAYNVLNGTYPQTISDFEKSPITSLKNSMDTNVKVIDLPPIDSDQIMYKACGKDGAEVAYYAGTVSGVVLKYLGTGSKLTCQD